jgi:hypothetical protein
MLLDAARHLYYWLPEGLQRAILVHRREALWRRAGIVFIHIPKAAGTSINQALYGRFMGHVHASDVERWGSTQLLALPAFAVTRNPWDRLVSAYRFARRGSGIGGEIQAAVSRPEQYRIPQFETFESFVRTWLAQRDVTTLDGIFQPQCLFVCDAAGKPLVDHLGRVDKLNDTYDFIRKSIGGFDPIERTNLSGEMVDYRTYYTAELAEIVGRIYEEDVALFGYDFSQAV